MRHVVLDNLFPVADLAAALASWPAPTWPGWVRYHGARGEKRASDLAEPIPPACGLLLCRLATMDLPALLGITGSTPDLSLWGAGLHELPPGGSLPRHRDAEQQPRLGCERVVSAVLFLQDWAFEWGGRLMMDGDEFGQCSAGWSRGQAITPAAGRVVVMDCRGEDSWHSVEPVTGPEPRRTLALFWYLATPGGERKQAEF